LSLSIRLLFYPFLFFSGTGSWPHPLKGLHLKILFNANNEPLNTPCLRTAIFAYSEQEGVYLHEGLINGLNIDWYKRISFIKTNFIDLSLSIFAKALLAFPFPLLCLLGLPLQLSHNQEPEVCVRLV